MIFYINIFNFYIIFIIFCFSRVKNSIKNPARDLDTGNPICYYKQLRGRFPRILARVLL